MPLPENTGQAIGDWLESGYMIPMLLGTRGFGSDMRRCTREACWPPKKSSTTLADCPRTRDARSNIWLVHRRLRHRRPERREGIARRTQRSDTEPIDEGFSWRRAGADLQWHRLLACESSEKMKAHKLEACATRDQNAIGAREYMRCSTCRLR